jgi:predicted site-specific integrase-resolvase
VHRPVLLRRKEVVERLGVSLATVKRWGAAGILDERHLGPGTVRITEESVLARISNRKDGAAA